MTTLTKTLTALLLFQTLLFAQLNNAISEGKQLIEKGYSQFDESIMLKARSIFERIRIADNSNETAAYFLAYCDYRLSVFYMQNKNDDKFDAVSEESDKICDELLEKNPENAEVLALQGALYGIMISNNWTNAVTLGPKSSGILSKALEIAPENPRVLLQNGISKFNTPGFFGGDKDKAIQFFEKAIEIYKTVSEVDSLLPGWGFEESFAWLGIAYLNKGDKEKARESYSQALKINPEFGWVKYKLLPALDQNNREETKK